MNIFYLDHDPIKAAQCLNDKHIVKMCLEGAQILSTVSWRYNVEAPYKSTHKNHPAVLWAGNTLENWHWTVKNSLAIAKEYTFRYGKRHKATDVIEYCLHFGGRPAKGDLEPAKQCMPKEYHDKCPVMAYRKYYLNDKIKFSTWREPRLPPAWFVDAAEEKLTAWHMNNKGKERGPIIRGVKY